MNRNVIRSARSSSALRASLCIAASLAASAIPSAQAAHSLDSIRHAAETFVRQQVPQAESQSGVKLIATAGALDARLRLNECAVPLQAAVPSGGRIQARTLIAVSCPTGVPWTIHVPVVLESELPVLVMKQAGARRMTIDASQVETRRQRVSGVGSIYVSDVRELQGRHLKRSVPAGTALTADMLAADILVKPGQQVILLAEFGGVEIRAHGKALTEGGARDRIRVQNLSSLKVVEGIVETADIVRVGS